MLGCPRYFYLVGEQQFVLSSQLGSRQSISIFDLIIENHHFFGRGPKFDDISTEKMMVLDAQIEFSNT
mgnify:CR=1 FL=1